MTRRQDRFGYGSLLKPQNSADRREVGEALELLLLALYEGAVGIDSDWYQDLSDEAEGAPPFERFYCHSLCQDIAMT